MVMQVTANGSVTSVGQASGLVIVVKWFVSQLPNAVYLTSIGKMDSAGTTISTIAPPFPSELFQASLSAHVEVYLTVSFNGGTSFSSFAALGTTFDYFAAPGITSISPTSGPRNGLMLVPRWV